MFIGVFAFTQLHHIVAGFFICNIYIYTKFHVRTRENYTLIGIHVETTYIRFTNRDLVCDPHVYLCENILVGDQFVHLLLPHIQLTHFESRILVIS